MLLVQLLQLASDMWPWANCLTSLSWNCIVKKLNSISVRLCDDKRVLNWTICVRRLAKYLGKIRHIINATFPLCSRCLVVPLSTPLYYGFLLMLGLIWICCFVILNTKQIGQLWRYSGGTTLTTNLIFVLKALVKW